MKRVKGGKANTCGEGVLYDDRPMGDPAAPDRYVAAMAHHL